MSGQFWFATVLSILIGTGLGAGVARGDDPSRVQANDSQLADPLSLIRPGMPARQVVQLLGKPMELRPVLVPVYVGISCPYPANAVLHTCYIYPLIEVEIDESNKVARVSRP